MVLRGQCEQTTRLLTNSMGIHMLTSRRFPGYHTHCRREAGRPRLAQVHPRGLCDGILDGIRLQKAMGRNGPHLLATADADDQAETVPEEDDDYASLIAFDDVTGEQFDPKAIANARSYEIAYFKSIGVNKKVSVRECYGKTGKPPLQCIWIDISKGDKRSPKYRSRLVANSSRALSLTAYARPLHPLSFYVQSPRTWPRERGRRCCR